MNQDNIETVAWMVGIVILAIGSGLQWGWPASFVAIGVVLTVWPLVKQFAK